MINIAVTDEVLHARSDKEALEIEREAWLSMVLIKAPKQILLRDSAAWEKFIAVNHEDYGKTVLQFAELWARLMEYYITSGYTVEQCADTTSKLAYTKINVIYTQYKRAVYILSRCWTYGNELRRWDA